MELRSFRHKRMNLNAKKLLKCVIVIVLVCAFILIWTFYMELWKIELVYDASFGSERSHPFFPRIVLKYKRWNWAKSDESPPDLVSLMHEIHIQDFSAVTMPTCDNFFSGNLTSIKEGIIHERIHFPPKLADHQFTHITQNCQNFLHERKYVTDVGTVEEAQFPIAYSILTFENAEQVELLLRAIYRPQNYYCIHVDRKALGSFHAAIRALVRCFPNVFLVSKLYDVEWGTFSVLEPELMCMEDLWKYPDWKYFINLTGKEFPLKTNLDIVKILKAFNGANNMEATVLGRNLERTTYIYEGRDQTGKKKDPPPVPVTLTKGSVHVTVSRAFVDYVLHDPRALTFRAWVKDTGIPDETFFSTLGHSPQLGVPGAYKGEPETDPVRYPFLTRFKNWGTWPFDYPCYGQRLRRICVFGIGDLPLLHKRPELFANKFHLSFQPQALHCMGEWLRNMTVMDIRGTRHFDANVYGTYDFVWNHI